MPLTKDTPIETWIHDFVHSDDPKFKGKSKEERIKMAKGAYYGKQNEEVELEEGYHRVAVTVSDPDHPAVSKRKEKIQRIIQVKGTQKDATDDAANYFKKRGYKVHDVNYIESVNEEVELEEAKGFVKAIKKGNKMHFVKSDGTTEEYYKDPEGKLEHNGEKYSFARTVSKKMKFKESFIPFKQWLEESKMSDLHTSLEYHLDKHIAKHKAGQMGADELGDRSVEVAKKIAKEHKLPLEHAQRFTNEYVDSQLK